MWRYLRSKPEKGNKHIGLLIAGVLMAVAAVIIILSIGGIHKKVVRIEEKTLAKEFKLGKLVEPGEEARPKLHYIGRKGYFGDAHPVYHNGTWYVYYLELPFNTKNRGALEGVRQGLAVSEDLFHWEEVQAAIDTSRSWWAVANAEYDGQLYSMYNDVAGNRGYGISKTSDYINFTEIGLGFPYSSVPSADPRDPSLFYNEKDKEYWFLFSVKQNPALYSNTSSEIYYSKTKDFIDFSPPESLFRPGNSNVPECPELFKMGDRYYLLASWGTKRVGQVRYRYSDNPAGPWRRFPVDTLTPTEEMAPNSAQGDGRRIMIGWIPTYVNSTDGNPYQWGGHMAFPKELYQTKDGQLRTRLAVTDNLLRKELLYTFPATNSTAANFIEGEADYVRGDGFTTEGRTLRYSKNHDYGELWFQGEYINFDLEMDISLGKDSAGFGVVLKTGNEKFNGYEVFLDPNTNQLILREHFERMDKIAGIPIEMKYNNAMKLRIITDGNIIEVYLDDKFALSGRIHKFTSVNKLGVFTEYGSLEAKNINIYSLNRE